MTARRNLAGLRFGRLLVLEYSYSDRGDVYWRCQCDCGAIVMVSGRHLCRKKQNVRSCGCLRREMIARQSRKHGHAERGNVSRLYRIWHNVKNRCENPNIKEYKFYGARGIKPIPSWSASSAAFIADVLAEIGSPPAGMSLDRIDNERGYEPGNIRWADYSVQQRNRRSNRLLSFGGRMVCLAEAAELAGISQQIIFSRLSRGWSDEEACTLPVHKWTKKKGKDRA